ncbi:MAG: hypothetical protein FJ291_09120 [Planctomycetes bacterium]|nr:hypothetical protein [Planctomycetota bacterium]
MWHVEDGFFGAALGAGLGVMAPTSPVGGFLLLLALLSGVVLILNRVGATTDRWRQGCRAGAAIVLCAAGWLALCLIGASKPEHGLLFTAPAIAWVAVKFECLYVKGG